MTTKRSVVIIREFREKRGRIPTNSNFVEGKAMQYTGTLIAIKGCTVARLDEVM